MIQILGLLAAPLIGAAFDVARGAIADVSDPAVMEQVRGLVEGRAALWAMKTKGADPALIARLEESLAARQESLAAQPSIVAAGAGERLSAGLSVAASGLQPSLDRVYELATQQTAEIKRKSDAWLDSLAAKLAV